MATPEGFDRSLALFLADCCLQAYNQFNSGGIFRVPDGYKLVASIAAAPSRTLDLYGYIIESQDNIVISFRGSRSNPDWIADAAIIQTSFPFTRVKLGIHSGFTAIYKICRQQLISTIDSLDASKQLIITGHSLGGALAMLCALDAAVNTNHKKPVMYNFGSPRVGNPTFVQAYNDIVTDSMRIVNTSDIVPKLPPAAVRPPLSGGLLYYRHVKDLVPLAIPFGSIAGNHLIENYVEGLKQL